MYTYVCVHVYVCMSTCPCIYSLWTSSMVHQFISSLYVISAPSVRCVHRWTHPLKVECNVCVLGNPKVEYLGRYYNYRLDMWAISLSYRTFWCIICLCIEWIIEGVNALYTFDWAATHTHMGFPINFNFNYLKHNVYYCLEIIQHMIPLKFLSYDIFFVFLC